MSLFSKPGATGLWALALKRRVLCSGRIPIRTTSPSTARILISISSPMRTVCPGRRLMTNNAAAPSLLLETLYLLVSLRHRPGDLRRTGRRLPSREDPEDRKRVAGTKTCARNSAPFFGERLWIDAPERRVVMPGRFDWVTSPEAMRNRMQTQRNRMFATPNQCQLAAFRSP
jgi:hypothetical protein